MLEGFLNEDLIIINFWRSHLKSHNMTVVGEDRLYRSISYIAVLVRHQYFGT